MSFDRADHRDEVKQHDVGDGDGAVAVPPPPPPNEYLALRRAKMARNQRRLRELGLLRSTGPAAAAQQQRRRKRQRDAAAAAATQEDPPPPRSSSSPSPPPSLRRSTRSSVRRLSRTTVTPSLPSPSNKKKKEDDSELEQTRSLRKQRTSEYTRFGNGGDDDDDEGGVLTAQQLTRQLREEEENDLETEETSAAAAHNNNNNNNNNTKISAREVRLDVHKLLFGNDRGKGAIVLGVPLAVTGKAFVMQESARLAGAAVAGEEEGVARRHHHSHSNNNTTSISFNKYAGIQEWGGGRAVFLWVNLRAPHGSTGGGVVKNEFWDGGRKMQFFGGARHRDASPAIQNLKRLGVAAAATDAAKQLDPSDGVVLWCRAYEADRRGFGPYVCLGRVSLVSYDPTSQPLKFVFNLLDYDALVDAKNGDGQVLETFRSLTGFPRRC